eukprot:1066590-Rhodomonas_salina.1
MVRSWSTRVEIPRHLCRAKTNPGTNLVTTLSTVFSTRVPGGIPTWASSYPSRSTREEFAVTMAVLPTTAAARHYCSDTYPSP